MVRTDTELRKLPLMDKEQFAGQVNVNNFYFEILKLLRFSLFISHSNSLPLLISFICIELINFYKASSTKCLEVLSFQGFSMESIIRTS